MIAWLSKAVRDELLGPQTTNAVPADRRCSIASSVVPPDFTTQPVLTDAYLALASASTLPLSSEIGGGVLRVRHIQTISLSVTDGDDLRGEQRRDGIILDIILRMHADPTLGGAEGPKGQDLSAPMAWEVDYTPLGAGLPATYAALTLTADVDLYLAR